jgi:uncharacterized delta-60 repeat protein
MANALVTQRGEGLGVALQRDGKIVVSGDATLGIGSDGFPRVALARFKPGGGVDAKFGKKGAVVSDLGKNSFANSVQIQSNGRIVIGGSQRANLQSTNVLAARYKSGGALDKSFGGNIGIPGAFGEQFAQGAAFSAAYSVALAAGGKVVLGGSAISSSTGGNALAVRLTSGGKLDRSFSGDGSVLIPASKSPSQFIQAPVPGARAMVIAKGDIVLAGHFDNFGGQKGAVWALKPGGTLDSRFGQGGSTVIGLEGSSRFDGLAVAPNGTLFAGGQAQGGFTSPITGLISAFNGFGR